jgi:hypothetical protein
MKIRETKLMVIDGVGEELLDIVLATVNYSIEGNGQILLHTADLNSTEKISDLLNEYEGLVLLQK